MLHRREALKAFAGAAGAGLLSTMRADAAPDSAAGRLERFGVALFTIPRLLDRDFDGALTLLAGLGYREVQFFGPYPFSVPAAHQRWAAVSGSLGLQGSGFFGRSAREVRSVLDRTGLSAPAMHVDLGTLRTELGAAAEAAHLLGTRTSRT